MATGVSQVSAFFYKRSLYFVEQFAIIESRKEPLSFKNPNGSSNLFGHDNTTINSIIEPFVRFDKRLYFLYLLIIVYCFVYFYFEF